MDVADEHSMHWLARGLAKTHTHINRRSAKAEDMEEEGEIVEEGESIAG